MGPTITLIAFAILCAWAILRTIGNERQRRLQDLQPTVPPPQPAPKQNPPLRKAA
jgi:hypothetical protein